MAIIERLTFQPCVDDPDDYRPNSSWAAVVDPAIPGGSYVQDLSLFVEVVAPGDHVPLHTHPIDEMVVVEDGPAELLLGDETRTVPAGAVMFVPAGVPHAGGPAGDSAVRFLGIFAAARVGITPLERNPAPGTEGQPPQPPYELDLREERDALG